MFAVRPAVEIRLILLRYPGSALLLLFELDSHVQSDNPNPEPASRSNGLFRWLFNPRQRRFMLPATGAWILALDWLLFSSNILSAWLATPVVAVIGFVLGSAGAYLVQSRAGQDAPLSAIFKAALAGIVVGIPWPIGGTLVGGWVLLSSGLGDAKKEIMGK